MGLEEPMQFFKCSAFGLEKYGADNYLNYKRNIDLLDIDDGPNSVQTR